MVRQSAAFSSVLDANGAAQEHTIAGSFIVSKLL
jgi:hypothetical protein